MNKAYIYFVLILLFITNCSKKNNNEEYQPVPNLSESIDLRDEGNFTTIKDQGNLGSCWAFACVGLIEYLIKRDHGIEVDLSEQHLVNCAEFGPMGGMTFLKDHGVALETDLPYQQQTYECNTGINGKYQLNNFQFLVVNELSSIERIDSFKNTLINHGPIVTHMDFYHDFNNYTSGIYEYDGVSASGAGHIIVIVGYTDDPLVKNGGYWICRNSWGEAWGESGYFKIPYDECNIGIFYGYIASSARKTGTLKKLPVSGYHCRWSKDGNKIAYTKRDATSVGIWVYDLISNTENHVVEDMDGDMHLSWVDNGTKIIFDAYNSSQRHDLWEIDIETKTKNKLIDRANIPDSQPTQDQIVCTYNGGIALFTKDGNFVNTISEVFGWSASLSPDGNKIAYVSDESGNEDIWIINTDGSNKQQITSYNGRDYWPRWSPDGKMLAFESVRAGNLDIWVYNFETDKFIQITNNPGRDGIGDWSSDGKSIVFNSDRSGKWNIYIYSDIF